MKKIRYAAFLCIAAMLISLTVTSCTSKKPEAVLHGDENSHAIPYSELLFDIDVESPQGFVYDVQDNCFVFAKGQETVVYPGSTSKLITALYALSVLAPEKVVEAGNELDLVKAGSSVAYIKKGHCLTVEMLIEGMLLPSGNDAAYVLAAAVGREIGGRTMSAKEAVRSFTEGINVYAKSVLGLCGTALTVPDGYADEEHYTTVEDMALVAKAAMENPIIAKYAGTYTDSVCYASGHTNTWVNTNKLLDPSSRYYSPYAIGLKTGSISQGYSLVFAFRFPDGREYIAGVFGAKEKNDRFEDAHQIIDCVFAEMSVQ